MASNGRSPGDEIKAISKDMSTGAEKKSAHLANLATATLKYLLLNAESDDLRFQAALAVLALSPVRRKMDALAAGVQDHVPKPRTGPRRRLTADQTSEVLSLIEQAEQEAGIPANTQSNGAKPLSE